MSLARNLSVVPKQTLGFKNRIINGAMVIDQRNAGASVTPTNSAYTLDRWQAVVFSSAGKFTVQQNAGSVTPPVGFTNYLGCTSTSAYSVTGNDIYAIGTVIEGYNIADLGWGTANAKTVTLSFQVYSSLTGTFGGAFSNASNRSYPFTYSIPVANTWTTISVTVAGDTTGTWNSTNGAGIQLRFGLGAGATSIFAGTAGSWQASNFSTATGCVSVVGTNGATFYITGVQLEVGSSATSFDYRQYGQELALCQRYYQKSYSSGLGTQGAFGTGFQLNATNAVAYVPFTVTPRAFPTVSGTNLNISNNVNYDLATSVAGITSTTNGCYLDVTTVSGGSQGVPVLLRGMPNTTATLSFSAEL